MLQIFTTQLNGKLKSILTKNEDIFESSARALAQACVSNDTIYIHGIKEMASTALFATTGTDLLPQVQPLFQNGEMSNLNNRDRVLLFTPSLVDEKTLKLINTIQKSDALLITICTGKQMKVDEDLDEHFTIFLQAEDPLVPLDDEKKIGIPVGICAAYAYECLYLLTTEILSEYEEEPSL